LSAFLVLACVAFGFDVLGERYWGHY